MAAESIISIKAGVPMLKEWQMAAPVDFEMKRGEHLAIVGPNAAGKSKLVDIILGKHPLKSGSVSYAFPSPTRKYVSENIKYASFQDCYGGDTDKNYYLQQRWNQWDVNDERILMSSGELRKYSLGKVLGTDPYVIILDNPYIGLDVASRETLNNQLREIAASGHTHLVLVLSRFDELPDFITHVVPVENETVMPKLPSAQWLSRIPDQSLIFESMDGPAACPALEEEGRQASDSISASEEIIRLNKVSIRYGARTILRDLDWVVNKGEKWSLMGPNGSGKSTLLSLVCADNPQSYACDITLFGRKRGTGESIWDIKKHIGYVSPELHRSCKRDLEAIKIVANGRKDYHGMFTSASEEDLAASLKWMEVFGVGKLADRKFMSLSSGEQRLVLLARAFVKSPDLLILDEPLHGLDNENRRLVRSVIETYCKEPSRTLIMVTHYAEELPPCIDHNLTLSVNR